jgi:hypothetical protein
MISAISHLATPDFDAIRSMTSEEASKPLVDILRTAESADERKTVNRECSRCGCTWDDDGVCGCDGSGYAYKTSSDLRRIEEELE